MVVIINVIVNGSTMLQCHKLELDFLVVINVIRWNTADRITVKLIAVYSSVSIVQLPLIFNSQILYLHCALQLKLRNILFCHKTTTTMY